MPICYFNNDYDKKYKCSYVEKGEELEIKVDYNIEEEIPIENGMQILCANTNFKNRDILVVDFNNRISFLAKNAIYNGHTVNPQFYEDSFTTRFISTIYFKEHKGSTLSSLKNNPKTKVIRIYSQSLSNLIDCKNFVREITEDKITYTVNRNKETLTQPINKNYIDCISVSNEWKFIEKPKEIIKFILTYYVEIKLQKAHDYTHVRDFVNELIVYMQLYYPDKFIIDEVKININNVFYTYVTNFLSIKSKNGYVHKSVQVDLSTFLTNCYTNISYRSAKSEIRNSKDVIITKSRHLEDLFGSYYRFIECYLKKKGYKNDFMIYALEHYYNQSLDCEKTAKEIITLRNHYIHSGYYIKNDCLKIKFTPKENKQNYSVDANVKWIYNQTLILYKTAIDIIFKEILNYPEYKYKQSF